MKERVKDQSMHSQISNSQITRNQYVDGVGSIPIMARSELPKVPFEMCSKRQRERLHLTSAPKARLTYAGLLKYAGEFLGLGRPIKSWAEVSKPDANRLIMDLEGTKDYRDR